MFKIASLSGVTLAAILSLEVGFPHAHALVRHPGSPVLTHDEVRHPGSPVMVASLLERPQTNVRHPGSPVLTHDEVINSVKSL